MKQLLQKQLREYVNRYEIFGDRSSMIMAAMTLTTLLNMDIEDDEYDLVCDSCVNID
jgi:hypothetical protein